MSNGGFNPEDGSWRLPADHAALWQPAPEEPTPEQPAEAPVQDAPVETPAAPPAPVPNVEGM